MLNTSSVVAKHRSSKRHLPRKKKHRLAPSTGEFGQVLDSVLKGSAAGKDGLRFVGEGKKVRRMIYSLSDGLKQEFYTNILLSRRLTSQRDVRKGRMAL